MVSHTRSRSKGSFSIFAFDTIRSFSRAGSRQASRIPSKDELRGQIQSSVSYRCDPNDQLPASPEPTSPNHVVEGSVKLMPKPPQELGNHGGGQQPQGEADAAMQRSHSTRRRAHRLRPKSWLSFSRISSHGPYPRSISTQLPKTCSSSTVARSVISAPVLTSTTNVSVARAEGVHCGEISDAAFSQSTWNSQVGWVATGDQDAGDTPCHAKASNGPPGEIHEQPAELTTSKGGRILRLKTAIRRMIRNGSFQAQSITTQQKQHIETNGDGEEDQGLVLNGDLPRRHAETLNLYKGKIKGLTGNGHIRRKSVNLNKGAAESRGGDSPLLGRGNIIDIATTDFSAEHSDNESPFGSLTKSFTSAVDKLDFHSSLPRNMSFLKSRPSFFHPKKGEKEGGARDEARRQFPPISPSKPAPPVAQAIAASSQSDLLGPSAAGSHVQKLHSTPQPVGPHNPGRRDSRPNQQDYTSQQNAVAPLVFSAEKNSYVPAVPIAGCPRGVNPLRMHPPGNMAAAPSFPYRAAQVLPVDRESPANLPPTHTPTPNSEDREGSDTTSLDDAPIYSPSLGDLSQYARDTPRSTRVAPTGSSGDQIEHSALTRSPVKKDIAVKGHADPLKKSKSGVGLFSKSKAENTSTAANHGRAQAESPLSQRDGDMGKMVKKSKNLHFGGLFKRKDPSDPMSTIPSSAFQPATPSPLRKVMRFGSQSTRGGGNSPTAPSVKK